MRGHRVSIHVDEATGDQYEYDEDTGETRWMTSPMAPPPSLKQKRISFHTDEASGQRYSYNEDTGETKWLDDTVTPAPAAGEYASVELAPIQPAHAPGAMRAAATTVPVYDASLPRKEAHWVYRVQIPQGTKSGDRINVVTTKGATVTITVPPSCGPGDTIFINEAGAIVDDPGIPVDPEGGSLLDEAFILNETFKKPQKGEIWVTDTHIQVKLERSQCCCCCKCRFWRQWSMDIDAISAVHTNQPQIAGCVGLVKLYVVWFFLGIFG